MHRDTKSVYCRLYSTTLINLIGDAVVRVALPLAFLKATGSIALAAVLASVTLATELVLSLPLAAIADRLPRRPLVVLGYIVEAICLILLAGMLLFGITHLAVFICIGCIRGAASQFGVAASAGYIPQLLGRDSLLRYHARVETIEGIAAIVGPSLAGVLVGFLGGFIALAIPAAMSFVNAIIYLALPQTPAASSTDGKAGKTGVIRKIPADIANGILYVVRSRILVAMQFVQFALGATTAGYIYGVVVYLESSLGMPSEQVGFLLAASGVGGIVASLVLEKFIPLERYKKVLLFSLLGVATILAVFSVISQVFLLALGLFLLDFCWVGIFIYVGTLSQYVTDDEHLARVDSISDLVFVGASALSALIAGWLISQASVTIYLCVIAATAIPAIISLLTLSATPENDEVNS